MIMGGETFSAQGDLVQRFLEKMDPRSPKERAEVEVQERPPLLTSDPAQDAPTDAEYLAAWNESIMPMQEQGCEEGCCS